jgi:hypothetical protein
MRTQIVALLHTGVRNNLFKKRPINRLPHGSLVQKGDGGVYMKHVQDMGEV